MLLQNLREKLKLNRQNWSKGASEIFRRYTSRRKNIKPPDKPGGVRGVKQTAGAPQSTQKAWADSWSSMLNHFDWQETREGVNRESRARVLLLGLPDAGKSTLLNRLCGWTVSPPNKSVPEGSGTVYTAKMTEDFGLFCLVDLPRQPDQHMELHGSYFPENRINGHTAVTWKAYDTPEPVEPNLNGDFSLEGMDPLEMAEGADLLVYVLDSAAGVVAADYRWVGRLRRLGIPLLVAANKCDLLPAERETAHLQEIESRLAAGALPVSAREGTNVADGLLPKMVDLCPSLTVALGRELRDFRKKAATRLIRRAAFLNGLVALEPVPLIDLPVQLMTLTGMMLRIGAIYERPPSDIRRREMFVAMVGGLAGRFVAQQLAKLVPVVGWGISSLIGGSATWALGRAAIAYFEAGGDAAIDRRWGKTRQGAGKVYRNIHQRWQRRPRMRVEWGLPKVTAEAGEVTVPEKEKTNA